MKWVKWVLWTAPDSKIFWHVDFGQDSMEIKSVPFWKILLSVPKAVQGHWRMPPSLEAASMLARNVILVEPDYPRRRNLDRHLDDLFMSIWLTENWSAEDIVNTILDRFYAEAAAG